MPALVKSPRCIPLMTQGEREAVANCFVDMASQYGRTVDLLPVLLEAERFRNCLKYRRVFHCAKCQHNYGLTFSCNSRMCDKCARRLYRTVFQALYDELKPYWTHREKTYGPKLLTLTFNTNRWKKGLPSKKDLERCQREARQFVIRYYHKFAARRSRNGLWYLTKKWRGCGAVAVAELGGQNNLHFHFLVYGPFITQRELSAAWTGITGDSGIVDIRKVETPADAVRYILKYVTKPPVNSSFRAVAAWSWLMKGKRRLSTYGVMFNRKRIKPKPPPVRLLCWFDGAQLDYRGLSTDAANVLLDWKLFAADVGGGKIPAARPLLDLCQWGIENRNFNMSG